MMQKLIIPAIVLAILQLAIEVFRLPIARPFGAIVSVVGMAASVLAWMGARSHANEKDARICVAACLLYAAGLALWLVQVFGV